MKRAGVGDGRGYSRRGTSRVPINVFAFQGVHRVPAWGALLPFTLMQKTQLQRRLREGESWRLVKKTVSALKARPECGNQR